MVHGRCRWGVLQRWLLGGRPRWVWEAASQCWYGDAASVGVVDGGSDRVDCPPEHQAARRGGWHAAVPVATSSAAGRCASRTRGAAPTRRRATVGSAPRRRVGGGSTSAEARSARSPPAYRAVTAPGTVWCGVGCRGEAVTTVGSDPGRVAHTMPVWRVEPRVAVWTPLHCKVQRGVGRTVQWPKTEVVTRL